MEAFGEIGLLPNDFYKMRYKDYLLLQSGFNNKRKHEQKLLRRVAKLLLEPYAKKGTSINEYQIWPIDGDKKEIDRNNAFVSEKSLAILKAFKDAEASQKPEGN